MTGRPPALLLAVVVLVIEALGAVAWAIFSLLLASALGGGVPLVAAVGIVAGLVFGVVAPIAAVGARRGRAWSWPAGVALQGVVLLGVVVAFPYAGWQPAFLAALALAVAGLAGLLAPATRRTLRV